ncbi:sporulation initiation factor Spo0A C-terminal domain-containing protein [Lacrimispora sp. NSJ-141]|uniref:Sporulation initiation factor Spo0A C-terminal domain-containing protein n=1 Tax=Lientehia hominis TaxID=2897778 RepID=A0AAP2RK15_9FIRM|nr:sporulation initiation factor Spo0A C-terminal domain-containing protein [Lientehia hominis]MCD2492889.1 sporulation initiation factor Spo0A C-terminal domain-containing protein [Lientehia hominis]
MVSNDIHAMLYSVGVSQCYRGYDYFITAISMIMEDSRKLHNIQREVYRPIAQQNNTSVQNVEKDIRTIRNVIMRNGGADMLEEMTGCRFRHENMPYPKEIIEIFAKYCKRISEKP